MVPDSLKHVLLVNKQLWDPVVEPIIDLYINWWLNTYYMPAALLGNNPIDEFKTFWGNICKQ